VFGDKKPKKKKSRPTSLLPRIEGDVEGGHDESTIARVTAPLALSFSCTKNGQWTQGKVTP